MIWGWKSTNRMIKCSWIKNDLAGKEYKWNDKMFLDKKWFGGGKSTNGMIKCSWIKNDFEGERVQMEW